VEQHVNKFSYCSSNVPFTARTKSVTSTLTMTIYCYNGKKESQTDLQQTNQHWTIILWQLKLWYQQSHTEDRSFEVLRNMSFINTQICVTIRTDRAERKIHSGLVTVTPHKRSSYATTGYSMISWSLFKLLAWQQQAVLATLCNTMKLLLSTGLSQIMSKKAHKENSELE